MSNPFTLSFGKKPSEFISRITQTNQILDDFNSDDPSSQVYMITGVRRSGKTVMLTSITDSLTQDKTWISVELNPERDMLEKLAASLYSNLKKEITSFEAISFSERLLFSTTSIVYSGQIIFKSRNVLLRDADNLSVPVLDPVQAFG